MPGIEDLRDKAVVVTGAASGIGREIALAFAKRGARLAVSDIDEAKLGDVKADLEALGAVAFARAVDVSRAEDMESYCDAVYEELGRVDILCNNAGVSVGGDFEDIGLEDWGWIAGVNLWGVIHGCHFFYPRMIAQGGGGHIVNIASGLGLMPAPGSIPYVTTKYGVVGLSETLRAEAAVHGIGVSVICPGFILTSIYRESRQCTLPANGSREEMVADTERRLGKRKHTASSVAEAAVAAVEKNRGVVRVCPETYAADILHRINRRAYDFLLTQAAKLSQQGMQGTSRRT
jgi:NAD(P)-dependent dehydrogenase (short-subunit alcohol dehydrogenase family)